MNPASFNSFIELLDIITNDITTANSTKVAIQSNISDSLTVTVTDLMDYLNYGIHQTISS